jgi:phosphoglycerate dehydrogenase-like enzyme
MRGRHGAATEEERRNSVATKIVFSPPLPKTIMDVGRGMVPAGYELEVLDRQSPDFARAIQEAEYFMGFVRGGMGADFYRGAPRLKLIQLISAGYDRLDVEAARKAGVPVANNGGANSVAVAEHTMMLMLAVYKRLAWQHNNVVVGKWRVGDLGEQRVYELAGKTLGIVGLGTIGKKVARRAPGFDMQVQYYDVVRLTEDQEDALGVRFTLFPELLRTSDVVSLHVPLNAMTRNMMSSREFAMMKDTAILINTCRGPVVDEAALYQALTTRQIAGAGLDVMLEEPPPVDHPLFKLENVTITPHMAGPTWENWAKAFRNGFDNIQRVAAGGRPLWLIPELR